MKKYSELTKAEQEQTVLLNFTDLFTKNLVNWQGKHFFCGTERNQTNSWKLDPKTKKAFQVGNPRIYLGPALEAWSKKGKKDPYAEGLKQTFEVFNALNKEIYLEPSIQFKQEGERWVMDLESIWFDTPGYDTPIEDIEKAIITFLESRKQSPLLKKIKLRKKFGKTVNKEKFLEETLTEIIQTERKQFEPLEQYVTFKIQETKKEIEGLVADPEMQKKIHSTLMQENVFKIDLTDYSIGIEVSDDDLPF